MDLVSHPPKAEDAKEEPENIVLLLASIKKHVIDISRRGLGLTS
jgi:hypothetical protein